jgi:Icc protein
MLRPASKRSGPIRVGSESRDESGTGSRPLRLLQLTDTHLFGDPEGTLLGQNTRRTFELVLELAREACWPVDRILLTGDLVHDESPEGYRFLAKRLADLGIPCSCLPGNHDSLNPMDAEIGGGNISLEPSVCCGAWNLVFLDSTMPADDGGHLGSGQLALLEQALADHADLSALVCLHHHPVPVGSAWMDTMALDNGEEFFAVIDRHPQVRGVLWGHVHQDFTSRRKDVLLLASPSTCIQFLPGSEDFAIDPKTPGFRWITLHPDGRIETGVERIPAYPDPVDLDTGGY